MFESLKDGFKENETKKIFYQGKFYNLDKNHKVVFAQNPAKYGGGRFEQKLFDDGKIPTMHLRDFPASYIYEKILKSAVYDGMDQQIKASLPEARFKIGCQILIEEYWTSNAKKKSDHDANQETVRELQEKALQFIYAAIFGANDKEIKTQNFISTKATSEVEKALESAINIRQKQREGIFPQQAVGLNGVLLEGDSGVGKSVLIEAVLESKGFKQANQEAEFGDASNLIYYKIDANLPLEQKKQIIVKAFEKGIIVVIDEINSCIDDGLEKILNAALTGDHPEGKSTKAKSGFMLISSINSAGLEGRSIISPALLHRTIQPKVKNLREYDVDDLSKIISHWISQDESLSQHKNSQIIHEKIAKNFLTCLNSSGGEKLNLRMLKSGLAEFVAIHANSAAISEENKQPPKQITKQSYCIIS